MKMIILAAGRGSRMKDLTADRPKCLVQLAGKALLDWQLNAAQFIGIEDIYLVRGYLREKLNRTGVTTIDNMRWNETNMVMSLQRADTVLRIAPCLVSYSDIVYHPDILKTLMRQQGDLVITYDILWEELWAARFDQPLEDAESFKTDDQRLVEIGKRARHLDAIEGQYMGLLKFTPNGWNQIQNKLKSLPNDICDRLDITSLLQLLLQDGINVRCMPVEGRWCEVDSASDLKLYEHFIRKADGNANRWSHDWRW
jgi:choline kinase